MKKYCEKRKLITFTCDCCGKTSEKPMSEYNRNQKLGRKNFCSRSCSIKASNHNRKGRKCTSSELDHLRKICSNQHSEDTPFNYILRTIRYRSKTKDKECNITIQDLKDVWNKQNGTCPYTGIKLTLPTYANHNIVHITKKASLDRIDSSKGYIKGNVQFVSTPINYMKNTMSDNEVKLFLKQISAFTSSFDED